MMLLFWIAQGIGLVICLFAAYGYFRKTRAHFLGVQVIINILYCIMYALLGVWSGAVANLISTAKFISFEGDAKAGKPTSYKKSIFFCALSVVFGIIVFDGWMSIIPIFVAVMVTFAAAGESQIVIRIAYALANILWVFFNFFGAAYVSAVYSFVEFIMSIASIVLLVRTSKLGEDAKKKAENIN